MSEELEPLIKPKRKYTKKVKIVDAVPAPTPPNSPEIVKLISDTENLSLEKKKIEIMKDIMIMPYKDIHVYIYYEGHLIDTLKYIKEFQLLLDSKNLGSQVIISDFRTENAGIRNCFHSKELLSNWKSMSLAKGAVCGLKIKERPRISVEELFELIKQREYTDDFIQIEEF
jgi:hypothetical protein